MFQKLSTIVSYRKVKGYCIPGNSKSKTSADPQSFPYSALDKKIDFMLWSSSGFFCCISNRIYSYGKAFQFSLILVKITKKFVWTLWTPPTTPQTISSLNLLYHAWGKSMVKGGHIHVSPKVFVGGYFGNDYNWMSRLTWVITSWPFLHFKFERAFVGFEKFFYFTKTTVHLHTAK